MSKKDFRRWAYKQMNEPAEPWPLWVRVLFGVGLVLFALRVLGVI